ncbi:RNA-directed DNA polymerase from mobile element jockey-like [Rhizophagus clarus]|uniref:RNA-directed DNA polymerase from mobile element jockey-like n=1 Tax=Rhizophagus clarus TaxID=94130 RepID=A0A8H3M543_9GLOM|nr:RNA-directed DNA polymerase from mobile element jockey-like [Rhizophagus clarus]
MDKPHWRHKIFDYFKKHFIKETTSIFYDDLTDMYTYIPSNSQHAHNKIDYIWCNIDLLLSTIDSKPHDVQPIIKTDYRMLTLDLFMDKIIINKSNKQTRQLSSKTIYCYDEMHTTDGDWTWEKFNNHIENYLDDPCINLTVDKIRGIQSHKQLNQLWNLFRNSIIESAKINIKQKKRKLKRNFHPLYDSDLKKDLNTLKEIPDGNKSNQLTDLINILKRNNISMSGHYLHNKTFKIQDIIQNTVIMLESKYINATYEYKKVYKNDNNEDILYTEENEVKEQTNLHFQTVAGAINCEKDLSQFPEWQELYELKNDIHNTIYKDLIKYPSIEEWIETIKSLSNDKATRPSGILYEMLKKLNENNQARLHAFICVCMDLNDIPDKWKKATIYPIPKSKPFFANLTNTRLIILLETPWKAFINAKENNKELWLLSQDLGKAYDRVNIFMLEKAMKRIKIPSNFIKTISNLFQNWQNQVITAYGLTDPYDVLIGIDQGEIISPLLWCIYYNPLLCEIEQRKLGYTIEAPKIALNKFYGKDTTKETEKYTISSSAYMDDTQWLVPSQSNLESILEITDSFYKLNDIQVNKNKSELLVKYKHRGRRSKLKSHKPVILKFSSDSIFIIPVSPHSSIRILGVYFDERNTF